MKVAWFTPLSGRSAIAAFSLRIAEALAEVADVELWTANSEWRRSTELEVVDFTRSIERLDDVRDYDLAVYHLGDYAGFHAEIYQAARDIPGVVVLHDRTYQNLFAGIWIASGFHGQYLNRMDSFYGDSGRQAAEASLVGLRRPIWESIDESLRYPMVEELLAGSKGAIVHSASHAEDLRRRWFGPVKSLFLPSPECVLGPLPLPRRFDPGEDRLLVVSIGHVNPNRHIDKVVSVLSSNRHLASRVRYVVLGPFNPDLPYVQDLQEQIARTDLSDTVELAGYQRDEVRDAVLANTDLFVNLRYPALEGASASFVEQLACGKPVLAYDTGSYAEVPDDAVLKVPPNDIEALSEALVRLVANKELRKSLGEAGLVLSANRTPESYAEGVLELKAEIENWSPLLALSDRVAADLAWMGVDPRSAAIDATAQELALLAAGPGEWTVDLRELVTYREIVEAHGAALARFFVRNDVPEVVSHFDPFPMTEEAAWSIARLLKKDRYYGAFLGDRIVALSMLRGWDEGYEVPSFGIAVDHDFHGSGIGGRMTDWTLEQARAIGCEKVRLSVYKTNDVAHALYLRRGFKEVERAMVSHNGREDERIVMLKELSRG